MHKFIIFISCFPLLTHACLTWNSTTECSSHGICQLNYLDQLECKCDSYYGSLDCSYEFKSQKTAFWLSLILGGFGADRFYLGYNGLGVLKMILGILVLTLFVIMIGGFFRKKRTEMRSEWSSKRGDLAFGGFGGVSILCVICFGITFVMGSAFFWLYDWISILFNDMVDENGYPLRVDL